MRRIIKLENVIEMKNVSKKYEGFELKNINLNLEKGTIMGLIGENGAGKSTTIKSLLNIVHINSGEIKIFGKDYQKEEKRIKQDIGVVLDDSFLSDYLTVTDINKIMKQFYLNWDETLFLDYIKRFGLEKNKMYKDFSSGMKMKVKIATAISHHPKLLILDEPTSGLDPIVRNEILDIFREFIQDEERSILISSHITSDLEHIADYITFINKGEIIFSKAKDELLDQYGIVKCSEEEFTKIDKKDYIQYIKNKYQYDILVENKYEFKRKYEVSVIDKPNIEDIMLIYVKGEK